MGNVLTARQRRVTRQHDHIETTRQLALDQRLRVDELEGKLEAFEQPPRPPARTGSTVAIPQSDAYWLQLERVAPRRPGGACKREPEIRGSLPQYGERRWLRRDVHRTGAAGPSTGGAVGGPV